MTDHSSTAGDPDSDLDSLADDPRVLGVAEEYLLALEAGQTPDRQAYLARYPELAGALAHCFDALELVHSGIAGESRPAHESHVTLPNELTGQPPSPLGDFQIVREIARGGMGVVYEAIQLSLGRRVALKVLPFAATFDSRQLQRFKNEAHAAALLHHTHIVPIYAVGCERGVHFYAMQLIDGQSLAVVIQQLRTKEGRAAKAGSLSSLQVADRQLDSTTDRNLPALPRPARSSQALQSTINMADTFTSGSSRTSEAYIRRAARLIVQAADALEHAHQEGVVHRDIKPANLLLDTLGKVWVTDFGLAQLQADNGLTRSGDVLGTFRYMSPEQTSGQRTMLDHRTDIYSLGATLYELLALEPVFAGETHQELLYQILHTEPRSLRELNRAVPQELETIVLKSLSKNAADRYRTVGEFAADIQRYLDHQPILARRPSLIDRGRKWARRHPAAVVATVLILAVVTALSLVSNWRIGVAQQRTTDALLREQQRATEAEERFQQAREAVDSIFRISEEELATRPTDSARRRILELVLSYYQAFIDERQGDPAAQAELARVQAKVKSILYELSIVQREMHTHLLESSSVQKELKLSTDQEQRMPKLLADWSQNRSALFEQFHSLSEENRHTKLVAMAEQHEQMLESMLTPAQLQRFRQIALQSQGLFAFKEPETIAALDLTPEQRAKIRDIEREMFGGRFRGPPGGGPPGGPRNAGDNRMNKGPGRRGPGGPGGHESFSRESKAAVAKVLELLSPEQREAWATLSGGPFAGFIDDEFSLPFPQPPR